MRFPEYKKIGQIIIILQLFSLSALAEITFNITISDIPNSSSGSIIGIPRQQTVCLSQAGQLIVLWGTGVDNFYKTVDRGETWVTSYTGNETNRHNHLAIWNDTLYNFNGYSGHEDSFRVQIIETDNLSPIFLTYLDTIGFGGSGSGIIASGQPTGNPDQMVFLIRDGYDCGAYWISNDRGRTWINQNAELADYESARMGLISAGDSCMALVYSGTNTDVWHYRTSNGTWTLESGGHFDTGCAQRVFSGVVVKDTLWVMGVGDDVNSYYVAKRQLGNGPITRDTLWSGNGLYVSSPEFIGYGALQEIKALNTVVAFYVHSDDGSAGPSASKLYMRVRHNGIWQPEQLVSNIDGASNLTCPFVVPATHGKYAYCQFKDNNGGHLAIVEILTTISLEDIDRAIIEFREGKATLNEVQDLIERYNQGL